MFTQKINLTQAFIFKLEQSLNKSSNQKDTRPFVIK